MYKVTRSGSVEVLGKMSYEEASKTITFTPSRNLAKGTYQATIRLGVDDKADNVLANNYTWGFSVG